MSTTPTPEQLEETERKLRAYVATPAGQAFSKRLAEKLGITLPETYNDTARE